MRIHSLVLQNFRQHADTRITFERGLTGIIGPNGSGKSTILEAIAWALYGMPAARGTRESIRSLRAPPRSSVRVELDFELGGHRYLVTRGLTSAELYLDGASTPIANSLTGVTELLRRRLGMSLDEFFNTYFTGQKELSVMAAMGPAERAQFLSRVLGYERLRSAQNLARDRRRIVVAEATGLRQGMPDPEAVARAATAAEQRLAAAEQRLAEARAARDDAARRLAALEPLWVAVQRERELLQQVESERRVAENEREAVARELQRLERELAEMAGAREELQRLATELAGLPALLRTIREMDTLCREEGRRQTLAESERALADEVRKLEERRGKLESAPQLEVEAAEELEKWRRELAESDAALEEQRTLWVRDRQEAETRRQALLTQYSEAKEHRERLAELGAEGICPTCSRPLGDHVHGVLEQLDEQMETVLVDGRYFKARIEQLEQVPEIVTQLEERRRAALEEVGRLDRRLTKCQLGVQELAQVGRELQAKSQRLEQVRVDLAAIPPGYDAAKHAELQREQQRLAPLEARAARLTAQGEREPVLARERAQAEQRAKQVATRIEELEARRAAVTFSEERYAELRSAYESGTAATRGAELAMVAAEGEAAGARQSLDSARIAQEQLARHQAQLDALTREKRLHDELDRAFTDMRTDLNMQLRPEISELASAFLHDLTDARYSMLELDESYDVLVLEDGIPKPVISGGEEDLANLVLRLAISQMIAERAGQPFSLLILDEVFGSLDESRRHNVVELLHGLHDRFEQVILITHVDLVREQLDQVITVRYDEETGTSRVVQEDPREGHDDEDELPVAFAEAGD